MTALLDAYSVESNVWYYSNPLREAYSNPLCEASTSGSPLRLDQIAPDLSNSRFFHFRSLQAHTHTHICAKNHAHTRAFADTHTRGRTGIGEWSYAREE